LEHALGNNLERVLILEDDISFCDNFKYRLGLAMLELPEDWDCLHLGGYSPAGCLSHHSPLLYKSLKTWGGYAYMVNLKAIPMMLDEINKEQLQVDTHYTRIMPDLKWFKTREMLVYHLPGYSDIEKTHRDIKELYNR
jgi:GR25 family glycosyltransferase involved in LPS biosynthesis